MINLNKPLFISKSTRIEMYKLQLVEQNRPSSKVYITSELNKRVAAISATYGASSVTSITFDEASNIITFVTYGYLLLYDCKNDSFDIKINHIL
jgi:hypothetical protein